MYFKRKLLNAFSFSGVGVHSGIVANVTVSPAAFGNGIVFLRNDVKNSDNLIKANFLNVVDTNMSTTVANSSGVFVKTVEHITSALYACGIFDAVISIDSQEVPIMDGSAKIFIEKIKAAGTSRTKSRINILKIKKEVSVKSNSGDVLSIVPSKNFELDVKMHIGDSITDSRAMKVTMDEYRKSVSQARTFGLFSLYEYAKSIGLAKGSSFDNTIALDDHGNPLNEGGFRVANELVNHKILDLIGDFSLLGMLIKGKVVGSPSHTLNNLLLREIMSDESAYEIREFNSDDAEIVENSKLFNRFVAEQNSSRELRF